MGTENQKPDTRSPLYHEDGENHGHSALRGHPRAPVTPDTADPAAVTSAPTAIRIPTVAWVVVMLVLLEIAYAFVGQNIAPTVWNHMHEFLHDGRHFLGIACH